MLQEQSKNLREEGERSDQPVGDIGNINELAE